MLLDTFKCVFPRVSPPNRAVAARRLGRDTITQNGTDTSDPWPVALPTGPAPNRPAGDRQDPARPAGFAAAAGARLPTRAAG